ncbi:MAG TPA: helix-turn-helix transcriptional regulator [Clostridia bacterium]|nr:helix-turn-helix transcriptional regulator [Clostridia bacterium]
MHTHDLTDPTLASTLRRFRRESGNTQEDIAFSAGITVAALARIERGAANPHWTTIRRITGALEISLTELVLAVEDAAL